MNEDFKIWARRAMPQFSGSGFHSEGGRWVYRHNIVQLLWLCWKAAQYGHLQDCACQQCERRRDSGELPRFDCRDSDGSGGAGETVEQGSTRRATARAESIAKDTGSIA